MRRLVFVSLLVACGHAEDAPPASPAAPATESPAAESPVTESPAPTPVAETATDAEHRGHLVTEPDGDRYWVVYRRGDAECDFMRLPAGATEPVRLFTDALGDFAEAECETAIAVSADGETLYYLHADEIRGVSIARPTEREVLARGERFPRELSVVCGQLVWLTVGGDLYEDDVTGLGAVRALELPHGTPRDLASGLTEPMHLRWDEDALALEEGGEEAHERRVILTDTRELPPTR